MCPPLVTFTFERKSRWNSGQPIQVNIQKKEIINDELIRIERNKNSLEKIKYRDIQGIFCVQVVCNHVYEYCNPQSPLNFDL